jgi:hypothetical protein
MRRCLRKLACVLAVAILPVRMAAAGPDECRIPRVQYNSALSDLNDALRSYTRCVSESRGLDDCSIEFSALQSAQEDFESAVSDYQSECG